MDTTLSPTPISTDSSDTSSTQDRTRLIGRIVTVLPVLFLAFDISIKLTHIKPVTDAFLRMGIPDHLALSIGVLQLVCLVLYLVPRTALLGGVLMTGFLGGAVSLHMRLGDPLLSHTLFPIYVGALLWLGLYLRHPRLREFLRNGPM